MSEVDVIKNDTDPWDLARFVNAQEAIYPTALREIERGDKHSHWMWFIFPQIDGLGSSYNSKIYAIKSLEEAQAYLAHPVLGARIRECAEAVLAVEGRSAHQIFHDPDDMKFQSSMTLFAQVAEPDSVFLKVLEKYYGGKHDAKTLSLTGS